MLSKPQLTQIILLTLLLVFGLLGYFTQVGRGFDFRSSISSFSEYINQIQFLKDSPKQKECFDYLNLQDSQFTYCKISDKVARPSVAIIGDSHANAAYYGFKNLLDTNNIGSILLADAGNPLYLMEDNGQSRPYARKQATNQILQILSGLKDIREVYIFTRGPLYLTGTEPLTGESLVFPSTIPAELYLSSKQLMINELNSAGKNVNLVMENPELKFLPRACIGNLQFLRVKSCNLSKTDFYARQNNYRKNLSSLVGVNIIDTSKIFFDSLNCKIYDQKNNLLYADDDHLSQFGSLKQAQYILSLSQLNLKLSP